MELLKKNIHMSRRKAYGENRMTLSEDFNIPDKKPDAAGLIQKRGEVKLEEVRTTEGQVQLSGTLEVHILYVSEGDERRLCRIQAEFPFEEKLLLPGAGGRRQCGCAAGAGGSQSKAYQFQEIQRAGPDFL